MTAPALSPSRPATLAWLDCGGGAAGLRKYLRKLRTFPVPAGSRPLHVRRIDRACGVSARPCAVPPRA